jgi:hypothetical protein
MQISKDRAPRLILDFFKEIPGSGIRSISFAKRKSVIVDNAYDTVSKSEVKRIIETNPLIVPPIQSQTNLEIADCDDYALQLKASLTALNRQKMISTGTIVLPPAIGIVITQNHVVNLVICGNTADTTGIFLIDPSMQKPTLVNDPAESASLLKTLPVKIIYL